MIKHPRRRCTFHQYYSPYAKRQLSRCLGVRRSWTLSPSLPIIDQTWRGGPPNIDLAPSKQSARKRRLLTRSSNEFLYAPPARARFRCYGDGLFHPAIILSCRSANVYMTMRCPPPTDIHALLSPEVATPKIKRTVSSCHPMCNKVRTSCGSK